MFYFSFPLSIWRNFLFFLCVYRTIEWNNRANAKETQIPISIRNQMILSIIIIIIIWTELRNGVVRNTEKNVGPLLFLRFSIAAENYQTKFIHTLTHWILQMREKNAIFQWNFRDFNWISKCRPQLKMDWNLTTDCESICQMLRWRNFAIGVLSVGSNFFSRFFQRKTLDGHKNIAQI